jgi:hypothetical protein
MKTQLFKNILAVILVLMISVITFYTWNLIFSLVSNYEALTMTSISSLPMVFFMIELYCLMFAAFGYVRLNRRDPYFFRKYSLVIGCFALLGIVSSILDGTIVYHTFVGDYVFFAMPLFMLIVHAIFLAAACYVAVLSWTNIAKQKPEKVKYNGKFYWVRETLVALLLMYALEKLGAIVLLPIFWSSYDSGYVVPFFIQLLVPAFIVVIYMLDRHFLKNRKISIILNSAVLCYSILSLIYIILMNKFAYVLIINPLSPVLQLERLITKPIGAIVLYALSLIYPCITLTKHIVKIAKEKKEAK